MTRSIALLWRDCTMCCVVLGITVLALADWDPYAANRGPCPERDAVEFEFHYGEHCDRTRLRTLREQCRRD
jgi:hypothetical protein